MFAGTIEITHSIPYKELHCYSYGTDWSHSYEIRPDSFSVDLHMPPSWRANKVLNMNSWRPGTPMPHVITCQSCEHTVVDRKTVWCIECEYRMCEKCTRRFECCPKCEKTIGFCHVGTGQLGTWGETFTSEMHMNRDDVAFGIRLRSETTNWPKVYSQKYGTKQIKRQRR